jgi:aryl-alcohol dehydrogenase-like predicted oxidoreductase
MIVPDHNCEGLPISSVALGTYLGAPDDETDARLQAVVIDAVNSGISYIDCAANYRCGRSERVVGRALATLTNSAAKPIVIGTKAGFLPYDNAPPEISDEVFFQARYIDTGIIKREWVIGDWQCYHPAYLEWQFSESLARLHRQTLDIFYLHNPEAMVPFLAKDVFQQTMREAFAWCMAKVRSGQLRYFGISSWGGLLGLSRREALSLAEIYQLADSVGGRDHFKFIQAPFSAGLTHALTHRTQADSCGSSMSLLRLIAKLGLHFLGSAPLLHGELLTVDCPEEIRELFPWPSATQTYLDFARSCPGIASAIVGTTRQIHLQEAAALLKKEPAPGAFKELFGR